MDLGKDVETTKNCRIHEEMREHLIEAKDTTTRVDRDNYQQIRKSSTGHPWMVYLSTFVAVCGSFVYGAMVGYSSPTRTAITEDLGLTTSKYSLFASLICVGGMVGAITSGPTADFVGRIWAMRAYTCFCAAGWLAIYFAQGSLVLDMGSLAGGYGVEAFSYVVPVYIAEIAPANLIGVLTALNQLLICTGVSTVFILGIVLTRRILALTGLIPCAVLLLGLLFVPESPRWLAKKGAQRKFIDSLQALCGKDACVSQEATEIQDYIEELERVPKASLLDLFNRRYLRLVIIAVGLMVFQQFGGINGVGLYVSNTFTSAGISSTVGTITYALLEVIITEFISAYMDKVGLKPLILVAATGLTIASMMTAMSFYLKAYELWVKEAPILALTGILLYVASFATSMGAVPWVIMSEIFPINVKGTAGSLVTLVNWFYSWVVSYTFNFLMSWSSYSTFLLYGAFNALAVAFVVKMVPETKGRSLEQIQAVINA